MLKLDDIIALAKQGYKPSDVKELIELSKTADAASEETKNNEVDTNEEESNAEDKTQEQPSDTGKQSDSAEADTKVIDYTKRSEELEAKLKELQKANTKKNIADTDTKSDLDVFADAMKSFM